MNLLVFGPPQLSRAAGIPTRPMQPRWGWQPFLAVTQGSRERGNPGLVDATPLGYGGNPEEPRILNLAPDPRRRSIPPVTLVFQPARLSSPPHPVGPGSGIAGLWPVTQSTWLRPTPHRVRFGFCGCLTRRRRPARWGGAGGLPPRWDVRNHHRSIARGVASPFARRNFVAYLKGYIWTHLAAASLRTASLGYRTEKQCP